MFVRVGSAAEGRADEVIARAYNRTNRLRNVRRSPATPSASSAHASLCCAQGTLHCEVVAIDSVLGIPNAKFGTPRVRVRVRPHSTD